MLGLEAKLNIAKFKTPNMVAGISKSRLTCLRVYSITITVARVEVETQKVSY